MPKIKRGGNSLPNEKTRKTSELLQKMREKSIEAEAQRIGEEAGLSYIDLHIFPVNPEDLSLIPETTAREAGIALFHKQGPRARFAVAVGSLKKGIEAIKKISTEKGWKGEIFVVSKPSIERAWATYGERTFADNLDLVRVNLKGEDLERFEKNFKELLELKENRGLSTTRSMEIIIAGAKKLGASDIHLEPEENQTKLRYRIDGILQEIGELPNEIYHLLVSRIKMIGGMRLNIRDRAQDGHFFVTMEEKRVDMRVSIIPGKYGESVNMRILSNEDVATDVTSLGLRGLAYDAVMKAIEKPQGMILNTGPTGSGKTTTLYTLLNHINSPEIKVITVEDPIEYALPGIVQTEVSKDKDYTFATALRAIVRQDPDVILIGEIRDDETADIAVNAALTGHLVFSTLHTNSAPATIPRFIELGMKPSLLSSSINVIIGQRLVRKLCSKCATSYEPADRTVDSLIRLLTIISPKARLALPTNIKALPKAVGCPACHFTGYKGRVGIFEVITLNPHMRELINNIATEQEIFAAALEDGMVTMTQDGILKAIEGITTLEEVWRVSDQTDELQNIYEELMPSELSRSSFVSHEIFENVRKHAKGLKGFAEYLQSVDTEERLPALFAASIIMNAADIHIEPTSKEFVIRFRLDGILKTVASFSLNEYPNFVGKIKLLGHLKSGERSGVVDSRFSITLEKHDDVPEKTVDVRLSIILGGFGETVEMRLLNQGSQVLELESLKIREQTLTRILEAIKHPSGVILNTGPTGSGKTTTLYSILARLNNPSVKIITVEDPIEYQLPGLLQTQVNEEDGYTFATALRALLRQNPDIMMIGEIRDEETASIAIQAASTGHLVLSTIHTNSAAGTVSRLMKMGISPDDLANAANLFMAQRLVRMLCPECKVKASPSAEEHEMLSSVLKKISPKAGLTIPKKITLWKERGCPACNDTGFQGQLVISEAFLVDQKMQDLISHGALAHEIEEAAIEGGMLTLIQDGILAVVEGRTSLEEVKRITDL